MRETGPSDLVSFESLHMQLFVVGLPCCPHSKQDLGTFLSQPPKNGFVDMMLASTTLVVSPFGASETSEIPVPGRPS